MHWLLRSLALLASIVHLTSVTVRCETGSVSIIVQDQLGYLLKLDDVKLNVMTGGGKPYPARFEGNTTDLPYGFYTLTAWSPGFNTRRQPMVVWQRTMTIRIALAVGAIYDVLPRSEIRGVIAMAPDSPDAITARLIPLAHAEFIQEDAVTSEGRFSFGKVEYGEYLLTIVSWSQDADDRYRPTVLYTKQVTVSYDPQDLRIEIPR